MNVEPSRVIDRFRQPEYTGENRCIPCTAVNVLIAVALAAVSFVLNPLLGVALLVVSLAAIYVRGYLVPGTPTLTKRYFPDWLLAKFEKGPAYEEPAMDASHGPDPIDERDADVDPERLLVDGGVVEPCADRDDLCLAGDLRDRWRARMVETRDGDRRAQVADFLETDPDDVTLTTTDGHVIVRVDGRLAARWESDAALVADLAGRDVLADAVGEWDDLALEDRSQVTSGLRAFVEDCPVCGGPISIDEETVESCCRSHDVYAITCDDCEARILEVSQ